MARVLFGRGSRGSIIKKIQKGLGAEGLYTGALDGQYGGGTERAVFQLQKQLSLECNGKVCEDTWGAVVATPIPTLFERCLQLTAAIEGHGFGMIQGNWDNAWLTWGVIGFTLKHGEIANIVLDVQHTDPAAVRRAFGPLTDELVSRMQAGKQEQERWANEISLLPRKHAVAEPWRSAFARFGDEESVQRAQIERARVRYFEPAQRSAGAFGLRTELGMALCFDIHVQNGSVKPSARRAYERAVKKQPPRTERARRTLLANAVADVAIPRFQEDVRSRKTAIARGVGRIHGEEFLLENWALGEYV